jgi:ribosome recycling factor
VDISSVFTVSVSVLDVSQPPVVLATVSVSDPAALNICPYHIYGNWLVHTAFVSVEVSNALTVSVNVLDVSHPPVVLATVSVSDPAALNICPYHVYGSWLVHTAFVSVEVSSALTVSVSVLDVSHPPVVLATVSVSDPAAVNTCPYHVYGSWLVHIAFVSVEVSNALTVNVNVLDVSQPPVVLATVSVSDPAALNTCPYHVYGS